MKIEFFSPFVIFGEWRTMKAFKFKVVKYMPDFGLVTRCTTLHGWQGTRKVECNKINK